MEEDYSEFQAGLGSIVSMREKKKEFSGFFVPVHTLKTYRKVYKAFASIDYS